MGMADRGYEVTSAVERVVEDGVRAQENDAAQVSSNDGPTPRMAVSADLVAVYPHTDLDFKRTVETALASSGAQPIDEVGVLAAAMAAVRSTYPIAFLQVRAGGPELGKIWDAFRDADVMDDELVGRARSGDTLAVDQLYERHQRLVYAVAVHAAPDSGDALDAVVAAFRAVIAEHSRHPSVRISLAVAARDAAHRAAGAASESRSALQQAVLDLAHRHGLTGAEIALVLRLEMPAVRALAIEGLHAFRSLRPDGYLSARALSG